MNTTEHDNPIRPLVASKNAINNVCKGPHGASAEFTHAVRDRTAAAAFHTNNSNKIHTGQPEGSTQFAISRSIEFTLIREGDAAILEQGVEKKSDLDLADFDDDGRRLKASASDSSLTDLEHESGGEVQRSDNFTAGKIIDEASNGLPPLYSASPLACRLHTASVRFPNVATSSKDLGIISMPAIVEGSSCHVPHDPAVDDDSRPPQTIAIEVDQLEILPDNSDSFIGLASQDIPAKQEMTDIDQEALARRSNQRRSGSFDRRMSESAQFAEAVGEELDSLLLRKIFEEDSSSDFDDDEIDEGGKLLREDEVEGLLVDENVEPSCVSTDLAQTSLNEEEHTNSPLLQQQGQLPHLSTTSEVGNASFSTTTPPPSACKPNTMMSFLNTSPTTSFHPPCYINWKFTRSNSFGSISDGKNTCLKNCIPNSSSGEVYFGYRGIPANPPVVTKRGMARGNYAQLHRKAWLEVSDKHHRYGKNLRMYYKHWETLGHPFRMFFDWLDSKGEGMGHPLPNLPEIPRPILDADTVLYITNPEISARYALGIAADRTDGSGIIVDQTGNPVHTGKEGWIFVLRDQLLYGSPKVTAPGSSPAGVVNDTFQAGVVNTKHQHRFHHSSFFGGKAVASAGIFITNEQGRLTRLYPHSGHYRPGEAHMQRTLFFFQQLGVELSTFTVDMQQIFKVSRKIAPGTAGDKAKGNKEKGKENNATNENGKHSQMNGQGLGKHSPSTKNAKKSKKTDCLHLMCGLEVACFLAHKALMIEKGVFHQIHKIRRIPKESRSHASFILNFVSN